MPHCLSTSRHRLVDCRDVRRAAAFCRDSPRNKEACRIVGIAARTAPRQEGSDTVSPRSPTPLTQRSRHCGRRGLHGSAGENPPRRRGFRDDGERHAESAARGEAYKERGPSHSSTGPALPRETLMHTKINDHRRGPGARGLRSGLPGGGRRRQQGRFPLRRSTRPPPRRPGPRPRCSPAAASGACRACSSTCRG